MSLAQVYGEIRSLIATPDCSWEALTHSLIGLSEDELMQVVPYVLDISKGPRVLIPRSYKGLVLSTSTQKKYTQEIGLTSSDISKKIEVLEAWESLRILYLDAFSLSLNANLSGLREIKHLSTLHINNLRYTLPALHRLIEDATSLENLHIVENYKGRPNAHLPYGTDLSGRDPILPQIKHLTLHFLGSNPDNRVTTLEESMEYLTRSLAGACMQGVLEVTFYLLGKASSIPPKELALLKILLISNLSGRGIFPNLRALHIQTGA